MSLCNRLNIKKIDSQKTLNIIFICVYERVKPVYDNGYSSGQFFNFSPITNMDALNNRFKKELKSLLKYYKKNNEAYFIGFSEFIETIEEEGDEYFEQVIHELACVLQAYDAPTNELTYKNPDLFTQQINEFLSGEVHPKFKDANLVCNNMGMDATIFFSTMYSLLLKSLGTTARITRRNTKSLNDKKSVKSAKSRYLTKIQKQAKSLP